MVMKIDLEQFEILKRPEGSNLFYPVAEEEAVIVRENGTYPPATYYPGMKTIWIAVVSKGKIAWYKGRRK